MSEPVSLVEVLEAHHEAKAEGIHTAGPAEVLSYNPLTQTCSVQPSIKRQLTNEDGETVYEELPAIDDVPVGFFRCGGFIITAPLAKGDTVDLIYQEAPIGEWRQAGGLSEPADTRRHSMGYPVAYPQLVPMTKALLPNTTPTTGGTSPTQMIIGKETGADRVLIGGGFVQLGDGIAPDFVAMATKVNTNITALVTAINNLISTYNGHTHVAPPGGGATGVPNVTQASTSAQPTVAAAVAKVV